jgi:hypothetical protein
LVVVDVSVTELQEATFLFNRTAFVSRMTNSSGSCADQAAALIRVDGKEPQTLAGAASADVTEAIRQCDDAMRALCCDIFEGNGEPKSVQAECSDDLWKRVAACSQLLHFRLSAGSASPGDGSTTRTSAKGGIDSNVALSGSRVVPTLQTLSLTALAGFFLGFPSVYALSASSASSCLAMRPLRLSTLCADLVLSHNCSRNERDGCLRWFAPKRFGGGGAARHDGATSRTGAAVSIPVTLLAFSVPVECITAELQHKLTDVMDQRSKQLPIVGGAARAVSGRSPPIDCQRLHWTNATITLPAVAL